jgi:hypothetical protein
MRDCELLSVISLPRVFKNNHARMAIMFLVRNRNWNRTRKVLLASIAPTWTDESVLSILTSDVQACLKPSR